MRVANYELKPNEIVCITSLMAKYLKKRLDDKKVYVVGAPGISEELNVVGLRNFGTGVRIINYTKKLCIKLKFDKNQKLVNNKLMKNYK